jgi:uncharacterized iron-regulated membrane protein
MRLLNLRYLPGRLHLWLGLALAIYAVVIGLTGSILALKEELQTIMRPDLHTGPAPSFGADPGRVLEDLAKQYPGWRPLSINWPHAHTPYWMIYLIKGPKALEAYVDARTGAIVGTHDPKGDWVGTAESLHANLSFGRNGRLANGYAALLTMLLTITGIYLLLPRLRQIRWLDSWRRARDMHYALGAFTCLFLLGLCFTGAYYTWSKPYLDFAKTYLGRTPDAKLAVLPGSPQPLPLGRLAAIAQQSFPNQSIYRLPIADASFPFRVTFREGTFAELHLISSVTLDPRTGEVLRVQRLADRPSGDSFLGWLTAFHFGVFGGRAIQLLWAFLGIATAALGPTGVWIWWRKR